MRIRWRAIGIGAAMIFVAAAIVVAPKAGRRLAFFRVHQVEVIGARYLDPHDVVRRLGLDSLASTLDRLEPRQRAALAVPGVVAAVVERRLPGTLRVTLHEAVPVALVPLGDHLALVDSTGHVLPFDPLSAPTSLPIAERDSVTPALLGRLMLGDPALYASVQSARLDRGDVLLEFGDHRIRLRPHADANVLSAVTEVLKYLNTHAVVWREIDARYRSRVFVQKGST